MLQDKKKVILIFFISFFVFLNPDLAIAKAFHCEEIKRVPILHEGRVKPLDSLARGLLLTMYGRSSIGRSEAIDWLCELLLAPESAARRPVFNIEDPAVSEALGLVRTENHKYSFNEVTQGFATTGTLIKEISNLKEKERTETQTHLLELYEKIKIYRQVSRGLALFDPPSLSSAKTASMESSNQYQELWTSLRAAYTEHNLEKFKQHSSDLVRLSENLSIDLIPRWKMSLEVFYNSLDPFTKALALYITSFIFILLSWVFKPWLIPRISLVTLFLAFTCHLLGLVIRTFITGRPPVTTLYESIIFVAFISVLFSLLPMFVGKRKTQIAKLGQLIGVIIGSILLFISTRYAVTGDTMGVLIAVLDTNFWLSTHVVTITIGYGACLVGGGVAHIYLLLLATSSAKTADSVAHLARPLVGISLVALFFCLLGTILGGIWADQSWGRFWGWDPKENGALVIVLWLLFLLHGRLARMMGNLGFAIGMVITNIVVALAWFGVNLLGVGLHSYGFTNHIAITLGLFCSIELFFATLMFAWIQHKQIQLQESTSTLK